MSSYFIKVQFGFKEDSLKPLLNGSEISSGFNIFYFNKRELLPVTPFSPVTFSPLVFENHNLPMFIVTCNTAHYSRVFKIWLDLPPDSITPYISSNPSAT